MSDAMVTGRMPEEKKRAATRILMRENLATSEVINRVFDEIIETGSTSFLFRTEIQPQAWRRAANFIDSLPVKRTGKYADMTLKEAKHERLTKKGLM